MNHRANPRFWRAYRVLPRDIRQLADRSFKLLKDNPTHPSLHFKKAVRFFRAFVCRRGVVFGKPRGNQTRAAQQALAAVGAWCDREAPRLKRGG